MNYDAAFLHVVPRGNDQARKANADECIRAARAIDRQRWAAWMRACSWGVVAAVGRGAASACICEGQPWPLVLLVSSGSPVTSE